MQEPGVYAFGWLSKKPGGLLVFCFVLFLMNVIIFIIRVLKLLFMHGKYFFLAFVVIMAVASPAAGSLTKISAGAPVYLGEQNLDISSGLQGCRIIDWWADGTDTSTPPAKNVTIIKTLEDSNIAFHYSIDPGIYAGYTGTWYCEDKKPLRAVFEVVRPQLSISFWDMDKNEDITGKTLSLNSSITYRIDTNLDRVLQYKYRPDITPLDSFYTVTLTDPRGNTLSNMYTGNYGKPDTHAIAFDSRPFISTSPYFWQYGSSWDLESRNAQGEFLYPAGTYSVTVKQNLNTMEKVYATIAPEDRIGLLEASAAVTFKKSEFIPDQTVIIPGTVPSETVTVPLTVPPVSTLTYETMPATRTIIPPKTTYSPLPFWIVMSSLGIACAYAAWKRR